MTPTDAAIHYQRLADLLAETAGTRQVIAEATADPVARQYWARLADIDRRESTGRAAEAEAYRRA